MTVKDLINKLSEFDENMKVVVYDCYGEGLEFPDNPVVSCVETTEKGYMFSCESNNEEMLVLDYKGISL